MKMIRENAIILDSNIKITSTTVRISVSTAHSESLNFETEKPFKVDQIKNLMADSPGIVLEDKPGKNIYPLALNDLGKDAVYVGRIRRDLSAENALNMWCVSDNLRKGVALNTVQVARDLINRGLVNVK